MIARVSVALAAALAFAPPFAMTAAGQEEPPRPLTFADLYGNQRLDLSGSVPSGLVWVDGGRYLNPADGPSIVEAATGESRPAFDANALAAALTAAGAPERFARGLARRPTRMGATFDDAFRRGLALANGDLFLIDFGGPAFGADADAAPTAVRLTDTREAEELPELSPDGRTAAFVRGFDLYAIPLIGSGPAVRPGPEVRLTTGGNALIRHGKADWVYYEELYDRSWKGYRWSPDSRHVAVMEYDDRAVGSFLVLDQGAPAAAVGEAPQRVERTRYPKTGTTNPTVRLGVVAATGGPVRWVDWGADALPGLGELGRSPGDGGGLLAGFGWFLDGETLYGYVQDRVQSMLSVRAVEVPESGPLGEPRELLKETAGAWVQSPGELTFLADGSFLIASTRDGWRHLLRYAADGTFLNPVTAGPWEVRTLNRVTDAGNVGEQWVYFTGTKDDPRGEHLYRVRPDGSDLARLTPEPGTHAAQVAPGGGWFLDTYGAHDTPPRVVLREGDGAPVRTLGKAEPKGLNAAARGVFQWVEVPVPAGAAGPDDPGGTLHGYLLTPPGLDLSDPDRKVPAWVMTYGGPHTPVVRDDWAAGRGWEHLLATNGIAVLKVDPRAASGRGWASAWAVHKRLGTQETADLVAAADWLKAQPWCDGSRLGLSGHSYGGYLTARVLTHSDRYAAGIAGGSVTAFAHYDTIYTERLMDTPAANPDGYAGTDLSAKAADLRGRLLLIHGGMDDNVHPRNVMRFAAALQAADRDFELMIYPRARHSIAGTHYRRLMWAFVREAMLGE